MISRLRFFSLLFFFGFIALICRLFYWQVYKGKELSIQARGQYASGETISAFRGDILASDGTWLAASSEAWLVYASLPKIEDEPKKIAEELAPFFVEKENDNKEEYQEKLLIEIDRLESMLSREDVVWVPLKNKIDGDIKLEITTLEIAGIGFEQQETRIYPESSNAAHLLGFVGKNSDGNDQGYFGLEGFYELSLTGKSGFLSRESDARGVPILLGNSKEITAIEGVDLLTHVDKAIQITAEKKLVEGIKRYGAVAGTVIIMEPNEGGILAMSSYPSYDPSEYWEFGDGYFRNPAVSSSFEPGSIFKVLIMASALDAGVVDPDTKCDICNGPFRIDKYSIETWDGKYRPDSSMAEIIVNSDNVGMVFVGQKLGIEKMYEYLKNFGIGNITGIDLQGEATPKLREKNDWSNVDLATASFGQGIATTPIQMLTAVTAIAYDGVLATPQVVDKIIGEDWEEDTKPVIGDRVISKKSASEITAMMVEAAKNGEAKWTYSRGFKVAGKTGTAQIPIAGHYDDEKTIASFIGFAPYDDPKFVMLVTLQEPSTSPWASETAAPLWYSIAKDLFVYFGIQPEG
ncbi:penicillin-binding protein 2 [Patescibacteria group bacterium]|nr:penicillin-binding protein 2 [Patescibacteria group bacterium]